MTVDGSIIAIDALGHQGDGVGIAADGTRAFVPFALPGERWRVDEGGSELTSAPSPERQSPVCRHFTVCGGCVAQHMAPALYERWKRQILVDALARADLGCEVAPLRTVQTGTRRRVVMTALRLPTGVVLGFHERASDRLIEIVECRVAQPAIVAALPLLQLLAARLVDRNRPLRMTVTNVDAGLDVAVERGGRGLDVAERSAIAALMAQSPILRVSLDGDPVVTRAAPRLTIAGLTVVPPPGVFLQAARPAEATLTEIVVAAAGKAKSIADLFGGVGTFSLPLARRSRVLTVDSDAAALGALAGAVREAQGLKPVTTRVRDLMREPLSRKELDYYDAVIIDPPRAGAEAQAAMLARSSVPLVVAVSCNPTSLARDLRILVDGGYAIEMVVPVDQFLFSAHLEAVAVLRRSKGRDRRR